MAHGIISISKTTKLGSKGLTQNILIWLYRGSLEQQVVFSSLVDVHYIICHMAKLFGPTSKKQESRLLGSCMTMAFSKVGLCLFVLACAIFASNPVHCNVKEDALLQAINVYRKSLNLAELAKNEKASCLADEIADDIEDRPCSDVDEFSGDPTPTVQEMVNFPKLLKECDIDVNTTVDGVILPVCVPKLVDSVVLGNYTHSPYTKFLNDSKYSGAGVGSEDDWIVVVLTTDMPTGSFSAASSLAAFGVVQGLAVWFLGLFVALLY